MPSDKTGTLISAAAPEVFVNNRYSELEVHQKHPQYQYFPQSPVQTFVQPPAQPPPLMSSHGTQEPPTVNQRRRTITWTAAVVLILATALVVGGAVGGGLGASLANCDDEPRLVLFRFTFS